MITWKTGFKNTCAWKAILFYSLCTDSLKAARCEVLYGSSPLPISKCHLDNGKLRTFPTEVIPQAFQICHFNKCKRTLPTYETWALGKKMSEGGHSSVHIRCVRVCLRAGMWTRSDVLSHHTLASYVAVCLCMVLLGAHIAPQPQTDCDTRMPATLPDVGHFSEVCQLSCHSFRLTLNSTMK